METIFNGNANFGGIYKITNKVTGRFYIGSTNSFKKRLFQHLKQLRGKRHCNKFLQEEFELHGKDSFVFEVVEVVNSTQNKRYEIENKWLKLHFDNQNNCYNKAAKANKRKKRKVATAKKKQKPRSLKQRKTFSDAMKKKWQDPEYAQKQRQKLLEANSKPEKVEKMRQVTTKYLEAHPERKEKFSKLQEGKEPWNKGRKATPEENKRNSEAQKAYHRNKKPGTLIRIPVLQDISRVLV